MRGKRGNTIFIHYTVGMIPSSITCSGVPFTPSNVMRVVREVEKWWGGIKSESLANFLYIPESKQEEIRQKFTDEIKQKKQSISYLINTDPLAGWRRLIIALDRMKQFQLAESVRPNAEPLAGTSIQQIMYAYIYLGSSVSSF